MAVSGTTLIGGAPSDEDNGTDSGAAYLIDITSGAEIAKLLPADGAADDGFGVSVAIDGGFAVVGAWGNDVNGLDSGAAYVFDAATGTQLRRLEPDDATVGDFFGITVGIYGTTVVVGANGDDDSGSGSGAAYLFDVTTGTQLAKLVASDGAEGDSFGSAAAIGGAGVIVGAPGDDQGGFGSGSAYLFDPASGTELHKLVALDSAAHDFFGIAVAAGDDVVVIGAWGDGDNGYQSGSAYSFDASSGAQLEKLVPDGGLPQARFGFSVAASGSLALIGAWADTENGFSSGSAYLFDMRTGAEIAKLLARDGRPTEHFGYAVAIDDDVAVIGARNEGEVGVNGGAVYVFEAAPSVTFRNGGTNPDSFRMSNAWIEDSLTFTVDLTTTGHTHAYVFGFDSPVQLTLGAGQTLLSLDLMGNGAVVDGGTFVEGPVATFDFPFPSSTLGLVGFEASVQAMHAFGVAPFALSNAQDLIVGGCATHPDYRRGLLASETNNNDNFGFSVGVSGTTAIIGAPGQRGPGAAYLFDTTTGAELFKLTKVGGVASDSFGRSVAIDGNLAIAGCPNAILGGTAHLFDATTGAELFTFGPKDPAPSLWFGGAVAIQGTTIVVSAPVDEGGAVYVFDAVSGEQLHYLRGSDTELGDNFGASVALDGTTLLVGAPDVDGVEDRMGAVYVFDLTTGNQLDKLYASDGQFFDNFGRAVALSGTTAVIGAPNDDPLGSDSGSVYVFDISTGTELIQLLPSFGAAEENFGSSLAMDGGTILVGAESYPAPRAGAVYHFDATTFEQLGETFPGDACQRRTNGRFGQSVSLSGTTVLVGAGYTNEAGPDSGLAYLFDL